MTEEMRNRFLMAMIAVDNLPAGSSEQPTADAVRHWQKAQYYLRLAMAEWHGPGLVVELSMQARYATVNEPMPLGIVPRM